MGYASGTDVFDTSTHKWWNEVDTKIVSGMHDVTDVDLKDGTASPTSERGATRQVFSGQTKGLGWLTSAGDTPQSYNAPSPDVCPARVAPKAGPGRPNDDQSRLAGQQRLPRSQNSPRARSGSLVKDILAGTSPTGQSAPAMQD
uniref:Uncharacterized protein n=1 Tax=Mycena chlorophos TaxID=658473 RepID=A0ABQ0L8G9_MYCCL|nr:predicted protein [Mycena chlorophos]